MQRFFQKDNATEVASPAQAPNRGPSMGPRPYKTGPSRVRTWAHLPRGVGLGGYTTEAVSHAALWGSGVGKLVRLRIDPRKFRCQGDITDRADTVLFGCIIERRSKFWLLRG